MMSQWQSCLFCSVVVAFRWNHHRTKTQMWHGHGQAMTKEPDWIKSHRIELDWVVSNGNRFPIGIYLNYIGLPMVIKSSRIFDIKLFSESKRTVFYHNRTIWGTESHRLISSTSLSLIWGSWFRAHVMLAPGARGSVALRAAAHFRKLPLAAASEPRDLNIWQPFHQKYSLVLPTPPRVHPDFKRDICWCFL